MDTRASENPAPYADYLTVKPEWLDDNGHMNVAYYMQAFDDGGEVMFAHLGIGWGYTRQGDNTIFMMNCDLDFRRELFADDPLKVTTRLLDWTPKLVHTYQSLFHRPSGELAATAEILFVHVSFADRKSTPMSVPIQARLAEVARAHATLPLPENLGRRISIKR